MTHNEGGGATHGKGAMQDEGASREEGVTRRVAKEQRDKGKGDVTKGDGDVWQRTTCDKGDGWFFSPHFALLAIPVIVVVSSCMFTLPAPYPPCCMCGPTVCVCQLKKLLLLLLLQ